MTLFYKYSKILVSLVILLGLVACAGNLQGGSVLAVEGEGERPLDDSTPGSLGTLLPKICSTLDFDGVTWPTDYRQSDQVGFALAMNVTGSFEGHAGWTNLSNNFDGQGVSMGILNQNLGQGSLQPLFIKMRDQHREVLESALSSSMLSSLLGMLSDWERSSFRTSSNEPDFFIEKKPLFENPPEGDVDAFYGVDMIQTRSSSASVLWAKRTLYTDSKGRNFKSTWKTALKKIAADPAYISLQIEAARYIHDRVHGYRLRLGWEQLRSYLFLFDIVVQNGGLKDKHFAKFENWLGKQGRVTEEEQMLEMLEIRVVDSNPKWQKDVRVRKTTTIKGTGYVHGEDRNLPVEYCYDPVVNYASPSPQLPLAFR